jgi:hypothetical protein
VKESGNPTIQIVMIPWEMKHGNLESLCAEAAMSVNPRIGNCVDLFSKCTNAAEWEEITLREKFRLRTYLAASHRPDPFIGVGNIWNKAPELIPLNHASFNRIAAVLGAY